MSHLKPGEFLPQFLRVIGKGRLDVSSHLLAGHNEERPFIPQLQRCYRAGTREATVEVIGGRRSYTLKRCMPNDDDDDDVIMAPHLSRSPSLTLDPP